MLWRSSKRERLTILQNKPSRAQKEEKVPGAETVLSNYFYHVYLEKLTETEEERVKKYTQQIGINIGPNNDPNLSDNVNLSSNIQRILQRRARVIKKS